jgi:hypothetical protein
MSVNITKLDNFLNNSSPTVIKLFELELTLHGLFWFHTHAQPRDKYVHVSLPIIHNYPLILAFLGKPVDSSYVSIPGIKTLQVRPEDVWDKYGFYIYPAIGRKLFSKTITFSMSGTGYVVFKPRTRASIPDYTANQVFLAGSIFKTYMILKNNAKRPETMIIRIGAKRYGVFSVRYKYVGLSEIRDYGGEAITHPFNTRDCPADNYYGVMKHYAGTIAISGSPKKVIRSKNVVLAAPFFIE